MLGTGVPFVGTFGHAEVEHAAALITRACQFHGDRWQPIDAGQIGDVLRADIDAKRQPFCLLVRNPFFRPDVWELVEKGFGRWTDKPGGHCELTEIALKRIGANS